MRKNTKGEWELYYWREWYQCLKFQKMLAFLLMVDIYFVYMYGLVDLVS